MNGDRCSILSEDVQTDLHDKGLIAAVWGGEG